MALPASDGGVTGRRRVFLPRRLRDRTPAELAAHLQHLGARQPVQVRRLHGHAARQVVQGGALRQAQLRRDRGRSGTAGKSLNVQIHRDQRSKVKVTATQEPKF